MKQSNEQVIDTQTHTEDSEQKQQAKKRNKFNQNGKLAEQNTCKKKELKFF